MIARGSIVLLISTLVLAAPDLGLAAPAPVPAAPAPASASAAPGVPSGLEVLRSRVAPRRAYFGGRIVHVDFRFIAAGPLDLRVEIVRQATGGVARRFALESAVPLQSRRIDWDGLTDGGHVAPDGRYRVRLTAPDGRARGVGALTLHSQIFPVRGPHAGRGPIGEFGAARSGGRTHEGVDVNAACGTPLVAARAGRVLRRTYDPVLYGNYLIIRGRLTHRDYWYAHLRSPAAVRPGQQVSTGQHIGRVGETGNARTTGCHLHFELRVRGRPIDPQRQLHAWDGWS